jgi:ankyrin repeat protein
LYPNLNKSVKWSILHYAVFYKRDHSIKFLLNNGSDSNIKDSEGLTPLQFASLLEYNNIFNLLINFDKNEKIQSLEKQE